MNRLTIKLPDIGEGVAEAELVEWHVNVGDMIAEDDLLASVMTDKATVEIPSLYEGKIVALHGQVGEVLAVGADLVHIESHESGLKANVSQSAKDGQATTSSSESNASLSEHGNSNSFNAKPASEAHNVAVKTESRQTSNLTSGSAFVRAEGAPVLASPAVRARARRNGISLKQVPGTGPAGRITDEDLDAVFEHGADDGSSVGSAKRSRRQGEQIIPVVGLRRKIAERMSEANTKVPHITVVEEIDVTELESVRATMNDTRGEKPKLTLLPFVSAALCRAVHDHPEMNAHFDDEAATITRFSPVHLGVATMTSNGLVVPVLRHAESLGLFDTATHIAQLADACRNGKAAASELSGSTITVSSLGPLGAIATTPIINLPEVSIVGINKVATRPMWDGTQFLPREMMNISASFDHRVIDGWDAAVFVQTLKKYLENPALIFIEG